MSLISFSRADRLSFVRTMCHGDIAVCVRNTSSSRAAEYAIRPPTERFALRAEGDLSVR